MFRISRKFIYLSLIGLFTLTVQVNAAESPFSVAVDPPSIKTAAIAGNSVSKYITVENTGSVPVSLKIYAQDWEYAEDGSKIFRKLGTTKTSLAGNIQLFANEIYLKPKASQNVYLKITSTKSGKGGYYSVIFFEGVPVTSAGKSVKSNVKLVGRIGTIIYHEVERTVTHNLAATLSPEISATEAQSISVNVTNKGNVVEFDPINLLIVSDSKKVVDRISLPSIKMMPGDKRGVSVAPSIKIKPGKYSAIVSFQTSDGPQFSKSELVVK